MMKLKRTTKLIFFFFEKIMNERFSDDYQPVMTFSLKLNATIVNITKIEKNIYISRENTGT